ncbi:MAG: ATP-binding cassette domain-containing protein [Bacillota bacterium]|jgi:ABC-type multidrug transport system ATPase subunit|nr:ATP-binding cassette domain-containing protein [Bacillota bacterium]
MILSAITFGYTNLPIFHRWSYRFSAKTTVVMGPTGCGKTTLFRLLTGLETPVSGTIIRPDRFGMVFQEDVYLPYTAEKDIWIVTGANGKRIRSLLKELGIDPQQSIHSMSGGMKRKVAIARCLLHDAPWLLMDEPFRGLDEQSRKTVIAVIRREQKDRQLLLATHRIQDAEDLCANILTLRAGINEGGTDGKGHAGPKAGCEDL